MKKLESQKVASLLEESVKYIFLDLIGNVVYFPVWWHTKGLKKSFSFCINQIKEVEEYLALSIWFKNIFTPMYGQYDWQGRIISFFIRIIQIIFRAFFLLIWSVLCFSFFLAWIALPIFTVWQIWRFRQ